MREEVLEGKKWKWLGSMYGYGTIRRVLMIILSFFMLLSSIVCAFVPVAYARWFTGETAQQYINTERFQERVVSRYEKVEFLIQVYLNVQTELEQAATLDGKQDILHIFTSDDKKKVWSDTQSYTASECMNEVGLFQSVSSDVDKRWKQACYYVNKITGSLEYTSLNMDTRKVWERCYEEKQPKDGSSMYLAVEGKLLEDWILENGTPNDWYGSKEFARAKKTARYWRYDDDMYVIYNGDHTWMGSLGYFTTPEYVYFPVYLYTVDKFDYAYASPELKNSKFGIKNGNLVMLDEEGKPFSKIGLYELFANSPFFTKKAVMYESVRCYWHQYALLRCLDEKMNGFCWEILYSYQDKHGKDEQIKIGTMDDSAPNETETSFYADFSTKTGLLTRTEKDSSNVCFRLSLPQTGFVEALNTGDHALRFLVENQVFLAGKNGGTARFAAGALLLAGGWLYVLLRLLFGKKEYTALCLKKEELQKAGEHVRFLEDTPADILVCLLAAGVGVLIVWVRECINGGIVSQIFGNAAGAVQLFVILMVWSCYYFALYAVVAILTRNIRGKTFKNCMLAKLFLGIWRKLKGAVAVLIRVYQNGTWKKRVILVGAADLAAGCMFFLIVLVAVANWNAGAALLFSVLFLCCHMLLFVYLVKNEYGKERIRESIELLSCGNFDSSVDMTGLSGDYLAIAQAIPQISEGMKRAVEKSLKDERMKTELIANVSHDIKTPLTSIINYVDLLKRSKPQGENVDHYLEVLTQKSQRLKQLIEDLVEASKVSSGTVALQCEKLDLTELLAQVFGEFDEKFSMRGLQIVSSLPEPPVCVYADGRQMFRILENLFQNIYKYAMEKTRVYVDLQIFKGQNSQEHARLMVRNISAEPLNISGEELTERFVRGDRSRNTEGSGLGLSIAGDLVQLQGGIMKVMIDGDLFKIVVEFPIFID